MDRLLNIPKIEDQMTRLGLNQSNLAQKLDLSREAISKWFKGENFPAPNKLLKLVQILKLSFEELLLSKPHEEEPIVSFRRKARRKIDPNYEKYAKDIGRMLKALVPYLPNRSLISFNDSKTDYQYIQNLTNTIRKEIGRNRDEPLDYLDLVEQFKTKEAIIVPVFLGERIYHENAVHIYLPSSKTTWIYLNLDSNEVDFKFWMAHELGHMYSPNLSGDEAEDFADTFAQVLLYPRKCSENLFQAIKNINDKGVMINKIKSEARHHKISPFTVYKAVENFAKLEKEDDIIASTISEAEISKATTNFTKEFSTISQIMFSKENMKPEEYFSIVAEKFKSPFFEVLRKCIHENKFKEGYVSNILKMNLLDSKQIYKALCSVPEQKNIGY